MSNYNSGRSIPISTLSPDELKTAVKEWAEGSPYLEALLWTCINNGVDTTASHAGPRPYLDLDAKNPKNKLVHMLDVMSSITPSLIYISPNGGNPFSGPDWYKPTVSIALNTDNLDETNDFFAKLSNAAASEEPINSSNPSIALELLDYLDFLAEKDTILELRATHSKDGQYKFSIGSHRDEKNFDRLNQLFQNAGFQLNEEENNPFISWDLSDNDPIALAEKMKESKQHIFENFAIEPPTSESEFISFNQEARFKMRELGDTPQGKQEFENWLKMKKKEHDKQWLKQTYSNRGIFASSLHQASAFLRSTYNNIKRKIIGDNDDYQK